MNGTFLVQHSCIFFKLLPKLNLYKFGEFLPCFFKLINGFILDFVLNIIKSSKDIQCICCPFRDDNRLLELYFFGKFWNRQKLVDFLTKGSLVVSYPLLNEISVSGEEIVRTPVVTTLLMIRGTVFKNSNSQQFHPLKNELNQ